MPLVWYAQPPLKAAWAERLIQRAPDNKILVGHDPPAELAGWRIDFLADPRPVSEVFELVGPDGKPMARRISLVPVCVGDRLMATVGLDCSPSVDAARAVLYLLGPARKPYSYRLALAWQTWQSATIVGKLFGMTPEATMRAVNGLRARGVRLSMPDPLTN